MVKNFSTQDNKNYFYFFWRVGPNIKVLYIDRFVMTGFWRVEKSFIPLIFINYILLTMYLFFTKRSKEKMPTVGRLQENYAF